MVKAVIIINIYNYIQNNVSFLYIINYNMNVVKITGFGTDFLRFRHFLKHRKLSVDIKMKN